MDYASHIIFSAGLATMLFCGDEIEERKRKEKERLEKMTPFEREMELHKKINLARQA